MVFGFLTQRRGGSLVICCDHGMSKSLKPVVFALLTAVFSTACLDPVGLSDAGSLDVGEDASGDQDLLGDSAEDVPGGDGGVDQDAAADASELPDASGDAGGDAQSDVTDTSDASDATGQDIAADAAGDLADEPDGGPPLPVLEQAGRSAPPGSYPKGARFAAAVSLSGPEVGVGYPLERVNEGFAQIQTHPDGGRPGMPVATFRPTEGENDALAGAALALDEATFVVGAPGYEPADSDRVGTAYYYLRDGEDWDEAGQEIVPDALVDADEYGVAVAVASPYVAVGAPGSDHVFVYRVEDATTFTLEATLPGEEGSRFGASVALLGDLLLAGAPSLTHGEGGTGIARAYERSEEGDWEQVGADLRSAERTQSEFGRSVAISRLEGEERDLLVVGSAGDGFWAFERGDAPGFGPCGYTMESPLGAQDHFGRTVALDGELLAVAGDLAVFAYARRACNVWEPIAQAVSPEVAGNGDFGLSLDLDDGSLVVGSPGEVKATDSGILDFGALYLYEVSE
jgi:hypothetical protein